ncbi:MAG: hypothetical protein R2755_18325 [Acidimicrobiales bacterium]
MLTRGRDVPYLRHRPAESAPPESARLERDGYALLPGVLDAGEVAALAADIQRVYDEWPADARRPHRAGEEAGAVPLRDAQPVGRLPGRSATGASST